MIILLWTKSFPLLLLVCTILRMKDFATSSLLGEVARDELQESVERGENSLEQYQIAPRREWEQK